MTMSSGMHSGSIRGDPRDYRKGHILFSTKYNCWVTFEKYLSGDTEFVAIVRSTTGQILHVPHFALADYQLMSLYNFTGFSNVAVGWSSMATANSINSVETKKEMEDMTNFRCSKCGEGLFPHGEDYHASGACCSTSVKKVIRRFDFDV